MIIWVGGGHYPCIIPFGKQVERERGTEASGNIRGENDEWVNKARKKKLFSLFLLVRGKKPETKPKFIYMSQWGPSERLGLDSLMGTGQWGGIGQGSLQGPCKHAQPLNLQQWHLVQGFLISLWRNCSWFSSKVNLPLYLSMHKLNTCVFVFFLFFLKTDSNVSLIFNRTHSTHYS